MCACPNLQPVNDGRKDPTRLGLINTRPRVAPPPKPTRPESCGPIPRGAVNTRWTMSTMSGKVSSAAKVSE